MFVSEDEYGYYCVSGLGHNLVQGVTHILHRLSIRRIYHKDDPIGSLIVVLPSTAELELTREIPYFDIDIAIKFTCQCLINVINCDLTTKI